MIKLAEREQNVPKAIRDARRKAIEDFNVITNTVVKTIGNVAENDANEIRTPDLEIRTPDLNEEDETK